MIIIDVYLSLNKGQLFPSYWHKGLVKVYKPTPISIFSLKYWLCLHLGDIEKYLKSLGLSFSTILSWGLKHFGSSYFWCLERSNVSLAEVKQGSLYKDYNHMKWMGWCWQHAVVSWGNWCSEHIRRLKTWGCKASFFPPTPHGFYLYCWVMSFSSPGLYPGCSSLPEDDLSHHCYPRYTRNLYKCVHSSRFNSSSTSSTKVSL